MLALTLKLDAYDESLFKLYLEHPIEKNDYFKQESAIQFNQKGKSKFHKWQHCLRNV